MAPTKSLTPDQEDDEVINVTLSRQDYAIMRDMIEKQKSLNWLGKYIRSVVLIALGGLVTLITFGEQLKKILGAIITSLTGGSS